MADAPMASARPDVDIAEDISNIMVHYPPLAADRPHVQVNVENGRAVLSGYLRTPISRRYLIDHVVEVPDVTSVEADELYDDDSLKLEIGTLLPEGVMVIQRYGTSILTGEMPDDATLNALIEQIGSVRGVKRIVVNPMPE